MALYIKDDGVDQLVESVLKESGIKSKTDAVRLALQHELDRLKQATPLRERLAALRRQARDRLGPPVRGADMKALMDDLWSDGVDDVR